MKTIQIEVVYKRGVRRQTITYSASGTHEETVTKLVYENLPLKGWRTVRVTVTQNDFQKE